MRTFIFLVSLGALTACAATKSDEIPKETYSERLSTGSNIPRKGNATQVDPQVFQDQLLKGSGQLQR